MDDTNLTENLPESFSEIETLRQQPNDVTLQVGNKSVPAHRKVLEMWSPVMKALLSEVWSQPEGEPENAVCELSDEFVDADIVDDLLNFFYTSNATLKPENAQPLCIAANYLNVPLLESDCEKYLTDQCIDDDNVFDLLNLAIRSELEILRKGCLYYLYRHKDSLLADREPPACFSDDEWRIILEDVEGSECKLYVSSSMSSHTTEINEYGIISFIRTGNPEYRNSIHTDSRYLSCSQSGDKIVINRHPNCQVFDLQTSSLLPGEFEKPEGWRLLSSATMNGNLYILGTSQTQSDKHLLHRCDLEPGNFGLSEVANECAPLARPSSSRYIKLVELNGRLYKLTIAPNERMRNSIRNLNGRYYSYTFYDARPSSFTVYEPIIGDSESYKSITLPTPIYRHTEKGTRSDEPDLVVASHAGRIFVFSKAGFESYCPIRNKWTCLGRNHFDSSSNSKPNARAMISVLGKLWTLGQKGYEWILESYSNNQERYTEVESFEHLLYELEWFPAGHTYKTQWKCLRSKKASSETRMSCYVAHKLPSHEKTESNELADG